jgi:hypothetical protein
MGFKMKGWSGYQNSPVKQKYTITWSDEEAKKRHEEKIKKEEEKKKKLQEKVDAQIEGTYVETEEDIKKKKEDKALNPKRPSPNKQVLRTNYWYKVNGKKVTYDQYKKAWKEGVDERRPNLQTNDPDAFGIKAKHKKDRAKLKKHTVLTEQQTKNLKK